MACKASAFPGFLHLIPGAGRKVFAMPRIWDPNRPTKLSTVCRMLQRIREKLWKIRFKSPVGLFRTGTKVLDSLRNKADFSIARIA